MDISINLLRSLIAASRARSLLAYLLDMSRRSLRGSLPSGLLVTISRNAQMLCCHPIADFELWHVDDRDGLNARSLLP